MKKITFRPTSKEVEVLATKPKPAKAYIPDWLKKVPLYTNNKMKIDSDGYANLTLKACMPFLDPFTSGYIQETWCDIYINSNEGHFEYRYSGGPQIMEHRTSDRQHVPPPAGYCAQEFTWKQPWIPQLPDGYSMLYTQPFNHTDLPFLNLTAIIDNDKFYMENNTNHINIIILTPGHSLMGSYVRSLLDTQDELTKRGITDPLDPITFPYLVIQIVVVFASLDLATATFSIIALLIPIALIGYTALSVLRTTTLLTPLAVAASRTFCVPKIFVFKASMG
jgi:hypothetical protein